MQILPVYTHVDDMVLSSGDAGGGGRKGSGRGSLGGQSNDRLSDAFEHDLDG